MARFDLTDFEWSVIQPLLPNKPRGVPRVDDRRVLNGIFWRLRTGAPWARYSGAVRPLYDLRRTALTGGGRRACGIIFWKRYQRLMTATSR